MSLNLNIKKLSDTILSCSVGGGWDDELGQYVYPFNDDGAVTGPNGELELDPDLPSSQCAYYTRPVFSTCKNNCPGGELSVLSFIL